MTRRAVLGAIVAVSIAGCRPRRSARSATSAADLTDVDTAIEGERSLLARYDEAIARLDAVAAGPLTRARDRHTAHLRALTGARRPTASTSPSPGPAAAGGGALALSSLLEANAAGLRQSASRMRSGRLAALLAAVAAEHSADAALEAEVR